MRDESATTGADGGWENQLAGDVAGAAVQARSIHGDVQFNFGTPAALPAPAQLPSAGFFADRTRELAALRRLAERPPETGAPLIVVVSGTGGVGKTTLALRWLHQIRESYTDGQLFVDLRGFSGQRPMPPAEPLERFLRALGVDAAAVPADAEEQATLFRTLTTGRRLIVMLDNAVSAAQVRPLLPGPGPALVVVTTRHRLTGLAVDGARFLDVAPLDDEGAVELLDRLLGDGRVAGEREQAVALVALCGRLPLAVCASGVRLAARRRWPIARVVRELTDETRRLATLVGDEDDASVQAVFNASYGAVPDEAARRLYRLLGLHPGTDFDAGAAAALLGAGAEEAANLLDLLAGANLLQEGPGDRYHFHDLVRLHARGEADVSESAAGRAEAVRRLTDWYLRTAVAADLAVMPGRWHLGGHYDEARRGAAAFDGREDALGWLERERANLVAVVENAHDAGLHEAAWQLCEAMWPLFLLRKHYGSWLESHEVGLAAARECGDAKAESRMLTALGTAHLNRRDFRSAIDYNGRALRLDPPGGHPLGEASALEGLGVAEFATGHGERAIGHFARARAIHEELGRPRGVALMTRHLGEAESAIGRHDEAIAHFTAALRWFEAQEEHYHQARTLGGLATVYLRADRLGEAADALARALVSARTAGARHEEAGVHVLLADLAERRAEPDEVRDRLRAALTIYTELGAPQADEVTRRLATPPDAPSR
ncbi:XRE family transcriptional regulator [Actinoallomurus oryzae]|uniref:XRE family transcriptional regulator n=1 Tax=Actinoallomurus oryzae TaxID=502180 RepID=A0ABP8Q551_9ACTN